MKGAAHIGRAFELLADIGRPVTATNTYNLLTSEKELKAALEKLTELDPTERRIRLAETFDQTYLKHEAKEQRAGEIGTSQNYLEYLGTPEIAEIFSFNEPDTCTIQRSRPPLAIRCPSTTIRQNHSLSQAPVATPAALPRSHLRQLLPPLVACRLHSTSAPAG